MSGLALRWSQVHSASFATALRALPARATTSRDLIPLPARAFMLALAYYLGARVGFAFQAPGTPQSVMWLPNSLLLAALLITPQRQWPMYLAAAFPAQLLVAWESAAPIDTMSLLYLTNCLDAVLGASVVRLVTRGRWKLDGLRSLLVFFACGALAGPALISFLDAAITVGTGWGTDYWFAFATRLRANTLTNVILVPSIVLALAGIAGERRVTARRRYAESFVLLAGLLAISAVVFSRPLPGRLAVVYLPIPFLLWAAVRLGPAATGGGLLIVAFVSSWNAVRGIGGFAGQDPVQTIISLQFFLLCVSIPLLSLAMVVEERESESQQLLASRDETRRIVARVQDLAGRLLSAQEEERNRIARDLHDGVGQYIAELALTVSAVKRIPAVRAAGVDVEFKRLYDQTSDLFESVRALSHQLHPSVLRHAGLLAAMTALCDGFRRQHEIEVQFEPHRIEPIPDDVALCVYRIAQEALRNIGDHAEARLVRVILGRTVEELSLSVADDGRGFDVEAGRNRSGLGLVSMEERVRLVHGRLDIVSGTHGSSITVHIPLPRLT
jgi:signal transduction histidine kinase